MEKAHTRPAAGEAPSRGDSDRGGFRNVPSLPSCESRRQRDQSQFGCPSAASPSSDRGRERPAVAPQAHALLGSPPRCGRSPLPSSKTKERKRCQEGKWYQSNAMKLSGASRIPVMEQTFAQHPPRLIHPRIMFCGDLDQVWIVRLAVLHSRGKAVRWEVGLAKVEPAGRPRLVVAGPDEGHE